MIEHPLALVGAGSLGQIFSTMLAASGQPVTLFATPGSADRLLTAGCIRLQGAAEIEAPVAPAPAPAGSVGVTSDPARLPAGAGLIFATKAHQLARAIADVRAGWPAAAEGWVAGVQNGIVKDDLLMEAFGAERVVGAVTIVGGQRDEHGQIVCTSRGGTYFGEFGSAPSPRVLAATAALQRAGLPTEAVADIRSVLWSKACNAAGVFGVSVLTRVPAPLMMRRPELIRAYLSLIREVEAIADANDVQLGDYTNFPIRTYLTTPEEETIRTLLGRPFIAGASTTASLPSMTQDLLAGRPLEVDEIFGDLVARAERAGLPAPRLTLARDLIAGLNPGRYGA